MKIGDKVKLKNEVNVATFNHSDVFKVIKIEKSKVSDEVFVTLEIRKYQMKTSACMLEVVP